MSQWYYAKDGRQNGPVEIEELKTLARSGSLLKSDLVWNPSMKDWLPSGQVDGIFEVVEIPSGASPTLSGNPYATPDSAWAPAAVTPLELGDEIEPGSDPVNVMACLKHGFYLTARHFLVIFLTGLVYIAITMAVEIPMNLIQVAMGGGQQVVVPMENGQIQNLQTNASPALVTVQLIGGIISQVVSLFLSLGWLRIQLNIISGREANVGQLFSQGGKLLRMIGATILYVIGVFIGCLLLIVPGIYFALRFGQYGAAIVDRDLGVIESLKYSSSITKNSRMNLLGLGIMGFLIVVGGFIALCVGLVYAIPWASLSWVIAYRWMQDGCTVVQPSMPQVMAPRQ